MEGVLRLPRPVPGSRFGTWLVTVAPELRLLAVIVGSFLAIGFLMGLDLPGR